MAKIECDPVQANTLLTQDISLNYGLSLNFRRMGDIITVRLNGKTTSKVNAGTELFSMVGDSRVDPIFMPAFANFFVDVYDSSNGTAISVMQFVATNRVFKIWSEIANNKSVSAFISYPANTDLNA